MTRAPEATGKPLVRIVTGPDARDAELVAAITTLGVALRPKRVRQPDAAVFVPWGAIYRRALMQRASGRGSQPRRRIPRGLLAAERR